MAFNLGSFAPLHGLLESDKLLQQRQYNDILRQQAQQQLAQQQQQNQALGLLGRALPQIPQMGIPQQGIGGQPVPPPQPGPGVQGMPYGQNQAGVTPNLAGSGVDWQDENPEFRQRVGAMLNAAPPEVRAASSVDSGFRTNQQQADIYARSGQGTKFAAAPPGKSLHEQGLAADWSFKDPKADAWVHQNAGRFGLGFPLGSRDPNHMQLEKAHQQLDVQLDQNGGKMIQSGVPGPVVQDTTKTAMNAGRELNPMEWGQLTRKQIIDAIEKVGANEPDAVKALAFLQLNKIMAPEEKMQAQMWAKEHQQAIQLEIAGMRIQQSEAGLRERTLHDEALEAIAAGRSSGAGGGGLTAGKSFEYTDKDGNPQTVMLREGRNKAGYVEAESGVPWHLPEGAKNFKQITASTAGGGRAGAQVSRQVVAGAEVAKDLQNVSNMPIGTTVGPTGDVEPGKTILAALKADFARTVLTDEDEINFKIGLGGLGRELGILMSPVYGGRWASDQLEPLIPRSGYTLGNSIMALARIRQAAENAIDGFVTSPIVGQEQKQFAQQKRKEMEAAIPWTVNDALAYMRRGDPKETFLDFVKKEHIGGGADSEGRAQETPPAATGPAATLPPATEPAPPVGSIKIGKNGTAYSFQGGDQYDQSNWQPVSPSQGPGATVPQQ